MCSALLCGSYPLPCSPGVCVPVVCSILFLKPTSGGPTIGRDFLLFPCLSCRGSTLTRCRYPDPRLQIWTIVLKIGVK